MNIENVPIENNITDKNDKEIISNIFHPNKKTEEISLEAEIGNNEKFTPPKNIEKISKKSSSNILIKSIILTALLIFIMTSFFDSIVSKFLPSWLPIIVVKVVLIFILVILFL